MSENQIKKLFLLDAYALIFRSYYAFIKNPRITSKGMNTSAIFGFLLTLREVLQKQKPTHIAVVFDTPAPTFRHKMFEEYKATRDETPEDIKRAVPYIKKLIEAYKIPITLDNVLWAYNAGIGNVKKNRMPKETINYIKKVKDNLSLFGGEAFSGSYSNSNGQGNAGQR